MVEIKRVDPSRASPSTGADKGTGTTTSVNEDEKYRLVYSKSKVYVNPTAYARDNIPGFVALVKRVCCIPLLEIGVGCLPVHPGYHRTGSC